MAIHVDRKNLKEGLVGLVFALVEIIRDALKLQAVKRMDSGDLSNHECERLGKTLMDLDSALEEIKKEQGIAHCVQSVRDALDKMVSGAAVQAGALELAPSHRSMRRK